MTSEQRKRRMPPEERRAEIVAAAARVGIDEGLERITLRRVADEIGVRAGLINHYFPEADTLVAEAFSYVSEREVIRLFPDSDANADERLVRFLDHTLSAENAEVGRLWLNARNLSRYNPHLRHAVTVQEEANNARLLALIEDGIEDGCFRCEHPVRSALLVLVLVDAVTGYTNEEQTAATDLVAELIFSTAEKELGFEPGQLSARSTQLRSAAGGTDPAPVP